MLDALLLSTTTFRKLSFGCQKEILAALGTFQSEASVAAADDDQDTATEFSLNEMRQFLNGISDKTRAFLEALATLPAQFDVATLLDKLGVQYSDIRGILAGLTKRSRTVSGNPDASFFESVVWDDDPRKCVSRIHPTTHASLKKLLKSI